MTESVCASLQDARCEVASDWLDQGQRDLNVPTVPSGFMREVVIHQQAYHTQPSAAARPAPAVFYHFFQFCAPEVPVLVQRKALLRAAVNPADADAKDTVEGFLRDFYLNTDNLQQSDFSFYDVEESGPPVLDSTRQTRTDADEGRQRTPPPKKMRGGAAAVATSPTTSIERPSSPAAATAPAAAAARDVVPVQAPARIAVTSPYVVELRKRAASSQLVGFACPMWLRVRFSVPTIQSISLGTPTVPSAADRLSLVVARVVVVACAAIPRHQGAQACLRRAEQYVAHSSPPSAQRGHTHTLWSGFQVVHSTHTHTHTHTSFEVAREVVKDGRWHRSAAAPLRRTQRNAAWRWTRRR